MEKGLIDLQPKVSIGIRSYNQKEFLKEAIDSVLFQDYENMEIVIGDDASTDGTREMLKEYDEKNPGTFKLRLNDRNLGYTANGNGILSACTGKYLAWLDGDDLFLPGKVKKQVDLLEANPDCAICWHEVEVFDSQTGTILEHFDTDPTLTTPREGGVEILFPRYFIHNCAVMARRDACPKDGFDTRLAGGEHSDPLFLFETALKGRFCYLPEALSRYRRHQTNMTIETSSKEHQIFKFLTLTMVNAKYPFLAKQCRISSGWAQLIYREAVRQVLKGNGKKARELFIESLRQGWVSWKWFGWFARSFFRF